LVIVEKVISEEHIRNFYRLSGSLICELSFHNFKDDYFLNDKFITNFINGNIRSESDFMIWDYRYDKMSPDTPVDEKTELEIRKSPEFKQYVIDRLRNSLSEFKNEISNYINPVTNKIKIYRAIDVDDNWIEHLSSQGKHLGIYWSWDPQGGVAYGGQDKGNDAYITSEINEKYVDWGETFMANMLLSTEREITLFKNTPLKIYGIELNNKNINIDLLKNKIFFS